MGCSRTPVLLRHPRDGGPLLAKHSDHLLFCEPALLHLLSVAGEASSHVSAGPKAAWQVTPIPSEQPDCDSVARARDPANEHYLQPR
jgi:hypothetical protein